MSQPDKQASVREPTNITNNQLIETGMDQALFRFQLSQIYLDDLVGIDHQSFTNSQSIFL